MKICLKCRVSFDVTNELNSTVKLCPNCREQDIPKIKIPEGIILTIDNFEDTCAFCEGSDGLNYFISLALLPDNTKEGDSIQHVSNGIFKKIK